MKIIPSNQKAINKKLKIEKGVIKMKRMSILSLAVGMLLLIASQAFALIEKPPIIEKNLSPRYQNIKIVL